MCIFASYAARPTHRHTVSVRAKVKAVRAVILLPAIAAGDWLNFSAAPTAAIRIPSVFTFQQHGRIT